MTPPYKEICISCAKQSFAPFTENLPTGWSGGLELGEKPLRAFPPNVCSLLRA